MVDGLYGIDCDGNLSIRRCRVIPDDDGIEECGRIRGCERYKPFVSTVVPDVIGTIKRFPVAADAVVIKLERIIIQLNLGKHKGRVGVSDVCDGWVDGQRSPGEYDLIVVLLTCNVDLEVILADNCERGGELILVVQLSRETEDCCGDEQGYSEYDEMESGV